MIKIQKYFAGRLINGFCVNCSQNRGELGKTFYVVSNPRNDKRTKGIVWIQCKDCKSSFKLSVRFVSIVAEQPSELSTYEELFHWPSNDEHYAVRAWEISTKTFEKHQKEERKRGIVKELLPDKWFEI